MLCWFFLLNSGDRLHCPVYYVAQKKRIATNTGLQKKYEGYGYSFYGELAAIYFKRIRLQNYFAKQPVF